MEAGRNTRGELPECQSLPRDGHHTRQFPDGNRRLSFRRNQVPSSRSTHGPQQVGRHLRQRRHAVLFAREDGRPEGIQPLRIHCKRHPQSVFVKAFVNTPTARTNSVDRGTRPIHARQAAQHRRPEPHPARLHVPGRESGISAPDLGREVTDRVNQASASRTAENGISALLAETRGRDPKLPTPGRAHTTARGGPPWRARRPHHRPAVRRELRRPAPGGRTQPLRHTDPFNDIRASIVQLATRPRPTPTGRTLPAR